MVTVIGVRFKKAGKIYYFDPDGIDTTDAKHVIVETARGVEFGNLVIQKREIPDDEIVAPLKKVLRVATAEDIEIHETNQSKKKEAFDVCLEKIRFHKLEMKLIDVEYTFDNNKVIFYFTSDGRVDFRELVKDLASVFRTRIELRQIGVRDEAKMLNGIGTCGRRLCCANWLGDFEPVSIKMAKDQNLSLNPSKISGICGRLMCCLKYEHEVYLDLKKGMPNDGEMVKTPNGKAVVVNTQTIREQVKVRLITGYENGDPVLDDDITVFKKQEVVRFKKRKPGQKNDAKKQEDDDTEDTVRDIEEDKNTIKADGAPSQNRERRPRPQRSKPQNTRDPIKEDDKEARDGKKPNSRRRRRPNKPKQQAPKEDKKQG